MGTILSIGMDPALLRTRHLVLQVTGAEVSSVAPVEAVRLLGKNYFDLIVICQTLSDASISAITELLLRHWPVTWVVLIGKHHKHIPQVEERLIVLMELPPPSLLIETVQLLLP